MHIIGSAIRAFLVALFGIVGFCVGIIIIVSLISLIGETDTLSVDTSFSPEVLPNAKNVRKVESSAAPVVLVANLNGEVGAENLTAKDFKSMLIESREGTLKDNRVKAILLHINSPGGTFDDADGIYRALKAYKEEHKVPVYAFVDGLCASGAMYIACAADEIYATDISLVGSVGVLTSSFFNYSKLMEKVGLDSLTLSAGKNKDELNPFRPWKPGEEVNLQKIIEYYYGYFVDIVTTNRPKLDKEKLIHDYGANIFPAKDSMEMGYIDGIVASRNDALTKLLEKIAITDDYYQVVQLESTEWWRDLIKSKSPLITGKVTHELNFEPMNPKLMNQFLLIYQPAQ